MSAPKAACIACGPVPANHFALWLTNSTDSFTLAVSWGPLTGAVTNTAYAAMGVVGRGAFYVCRALGIITLSNDTARCVSERTKLLWQEAERRGIHIRQMIFFGMPSDSFVGKFGGRTRFFKSIPLLPTDDAALRMDDKIWFKQAMREDGFPVPKSRSARTYKDALAALRDFGTVCVKPRSGSNGRHTYPYVKTEEDLRQAFKSVKQVCLYASMEEHLEGNLCRATCVSGSLVGFLESGYPTVTGDGASTIRELVAAENANRRERVEEIVLTASHEGYIHRRGYSLDTVLPAGVSLPLTYRAGYGQGGWNKEYGRAIHPSFIPIIERAAKRTRLSVVGFDLIVPDPLMSADSQKWGFVEANSLPWIDLHNAPLYGTPIDLAPYVWDMWGTQNSAE